MVNPRVGSFNTSQVAQWQATKQLNWYRYIFDRYFEAPRIAHGITTLDLGNPRLKLDTYSTEINTRSFTIHIDAAESTRISTAGAAWLEIPKGLENFQCGEYSLNPEKVNAQQTCPKTKVIGFKNEFCSAPEVVVWISGFDMAEGSQKKFHLKTSAADITRSKFTLKIESGETVLYDIKVTWVAYRADLPGVLSGRELLKPPALGGEQNAVYRARPITKTIKFPTGLFSQTPSTIVAIDELSYGSSTGIRMATGVVQKDTNNTQITLEAKTWFNSVCDGIGVSYIILE